MKKFWMNLILASFAVAGFAGTALADDCGLPNDIFNQLKKDVNASRSQDAKLKVINHRLSDAAVSSSQAVTLLGMLKDNRTEAAIDLYRNVCDPEDWYQIYSIKNKKGLDMNQIAYATRFIDSKDEDYNFKHHPEWYKHGFNKRNQAWKGQYSRPAAPAHGNNLQAEVDRLNRENSQLKDEVAKLQRALDESRNNHGHRGNACTPMDNTTFHLFSTTLKNLNMQDDYRNLLRLISRTDNLTVDQVVSLIKDTRISDKQEDIAVHMYPLVCDKNNWNRIYPVLSGHNSAATINRRLGI